MTEPQQQRTDRSEPSAVEHLARWGEKGKDWLLLDYILSLIFTESTSYRKPNYDLLRTDLYL